MTKQIIKLSGILCAITFIVVLLLSIVNSVTADIIYENAVKSENAAKEELIDADSFNDMGDGIFIALKGGECVGYCVKAETKGYGGVIKLLVGFDEKLKVSGIKITESQETAGLGSKAGEPSFSEALRGKEPLLKVKKNGGGGKSEVDAISGATITSTAVVNAINESYKELCARLKGVEK